MIKTLTILLGTVLLSAFFGWGCQGSSDCTSDCVGKSCGDDDGCGGMCTTCPAGQICNAAIWQCQGGGCIPDCIYTICGGDDGCGGKCTGCPSGQICNAATWQCQSLGCTPDCTYKTCGQEDGCGGKCTGCPSGQICNAATWQCQSAGCIPDCDGRTCGQNDGCGGKCTGCPSGQICNSATWQCEEGSCLVAAYNFDEGSGTVIHDSSGNGLDGVLIDPAGTAWGVGVSGSALFSNGYELANWVEIDNNAAFNISSAVTVEAWVKVLGSTEDWQIIVSKWYVPGCDSSVGYLLELQPSGDVLQFPIRGPNTICDDGYSFCSANDFLTFGTWHHVAATYDATTAEARLYVDGKETVISTTGGEFMGNVGPVFLGAHDCEYDRNPLNGYIDEVRIWCRALDAAEIRAHYDKY